MLSAAEEVGVVGLISRRFRMNDTGKQAPRLTDLYAITHIIIQRKDEHASQRYRRVIDGVCMYMGRIGAHRGAQEHVWAQ